MTIPTMVETQRFGDISVTDDDIVVFPDGLVGLPAYRTFVVVEHKPGSPFRWLQSLDDGSVAFLVVDPAQFVDGYAPEMPESDASALQIEESTPIVVYTVCSIPNGDPKGMTLNLAGPVVINAEKRIARQVVLQEDSYPVRCAVFAQERTEAA